mgnify:FL=1
MQLEENKTRWAVYDDILKIWYNGDLVGEVPLQEFPHLIVALAKSLRHKDRLT